MRLLYSFICCLTIFSTFTACSTHTTPVNELIDSSIARSRFLEVTNRDSNGAKIECKRITSDEVEAKNINGERKKPKGLKPETRHGLETSGFCTGKKYVLYVVNTLLVKTCLGSLIANSDGQLVFENDGFPLSNLKLCLGKFMKGEQNYYVLVSEDDHSCLAVAFTPNPIEYKWDDGAYVCAKLLTEDACMFEIHGKGFQPDEPLVISFQTCDEYIVSATQAYSDGTYTSLLLPAVKGVKGAEGVISIKREKLEEVGTLNYF